MTLQFTSLVSFTKIFIRSLKRLATNNATFALKWVKKAKKEHFQNINLSELLTAKIFAKLSAPFLATKLKLIIKLAIIKF